MSKKTIFSVVALVGAYVMCQLIADVAATRFVQIGSVVMPAGTFVFALTFTLRDMLHKRLGKEWAQTAIWVAAGANVFLAAYLWAVSRIVSPEWFALSDAWASIFTIVPAITIGSIVAELVSELIDTEVYHLWSMKFAKGPQWLRVLVSNAVSIPVDSFVFSTLAFVLLPTLFGGDALSVSEILPRVVSGQVLYKAAVTLVSLPAIYLVKEEKIV